MELEKKQLKIERTTGQFVERGRHGLCFVRHFETDTCQKRLKHENVN